MLTLREICIYSYIFPIPQEIVILCGFCDLFPVVTSMPIVSSHGLFNTGTLPGDVVNNEDNDTFKSAFRDHLIKMGEESRKLIFDFYSTQVFISLNFNF